MELMYNQRAYFKLLPQDWYVNRFTKIWCCSRFSLRCVTLCYFLCHRGESSLAWWSISELRSNRSVGTKGIRRRRCRADSVAVDIESIVVIRPVFHACRSLLATTDSGMFVPLVSGTLNSSVDPMLTTMRMPRLS
jgi:hypothetical protein